MPKYLHIMGLSPLQNDNWQLPYQAVVLPPDKWPSGYNNLKPGVLEDRHNKLSRFVVVQPPLPFYAGESAKHGLLLDRSWTGSGLQVSNALH